MYQHNSYSQPGELRYTCNKQVPDRSTHLNIAVNVTSRRGVIIMMKLLYYSIAWPFILIGTVAEFLVWGLLSDYRWKQREVQSNPAIRWQNEALAARRLLRELEEKSRRQEEELKERKK